MKFSELFEDLKLSNSEKESIFRQISDKLTSLKYGEYYVAHVTDDFRNTCRFVLIEYLGTPDSINTFKPIKTVKEKDLDNYNLL